MNYFHYFQDQIETEKRRQERARQIARARIESALRHLEPLLHGLERALTGQIYRFRRDGLDYESLLRWHQCIDLDDLRASFRLMADHHPVVEIQLGPASVLLTNCWEHRQCKLHDFTAQDVERWAQTISNWIVPHILDRRSSPF